MIEEKQTSVPPGGEFTIKIEYMRAEHVPAVIEIEDVSFGTPWSERAYFHEIDNKAAIYIVALNAEGELIGYTGAWVVMDEAHITTIAIRPDCRGHKLGQALMVALLDLARDRGSTRATLEVRPSNAVALSIYLKCGFHSVGRRKAYYSNNREDAIIMWLDSYDLDVYQTYASGVRPLITWGEGVGRNA
jgi:ribosomal-protein-alanine N-acetyltransferase